MLSLAAATVLTRLVYPHRCNVDAVGFRSQTEHCKATCRVTRSPGGSSRVDSLLTAPPYPRRFKRDSPYPPLPTSTRLTRLYPLPAANLARSVWFGSFAFPPLGSPRHGLWRASRVANGALLVQLDYLRVRMDSFTRTILRHIVVRYESSRLCLSTYFTWK